MKKFILIALLSAGSISSAFGQSASIEQETVSVSEKIDRVFSYFEFMGKELKVDETVHLHLFAPDFKMIINGKVVLDGRENLTPHFELLFSQVSRIDLVLHEKIVSNDKAIMHYDLKKPGKSTTKVIAIFKFRDGLLYEMNEVIHSLDPSREIDFSSR